MIINGQRFSGRALTAVKQPPQSPITTASQYLDSLNLSADIREAVEFEAYNRLCNNAIYRELAAENRNGFLSSADFMKYTEPMRLKFTRSVCLALVTPAQMR